MRHPSTARRDGDLSRLTSSSSSSPSSSTTTDASHNNGNFYLPADEAPLHGAVATAATTAADGNGLGDVAASSAASAAPGSSGFRSTYLPAVIDPGDWQATHSRKRKDRHDSSSSSTQHDRKLVRSNSEEFIPNAGAAERRSAPVHIRRVCSHEEFKRPLRERCATNGGAATSAEAPERSSGNGRRRCGAQLSHLALIHAAGDAADGAEADADLVAEAEADKWANNEVQDILKETTTVSAHSHRSRNEISPARTRVFDFSHKIRVSPSRDASAKMSSSGSRSGHGSNGGDPDVDGEHERRRSSERFCRARAPAGRKQSAKRPSKYLAARLRGGRDESVYKYDLQVSKGERRGFVSGAGGGKQQPQRSGDEENNDPLLVAQQQQPPQPQQPQQHHDVNDNNLNDITTTTTTATSPPIHQHQHHHHQHQHQRQHQQHHGAQSPKAKRKADTADVAAASGAAASLPWSFQSDDQTPVVCPRFGDTTYAQVHHHRAVDFDDTTAAEDAEHQRHHRRRSSSSSENTTTCGTVSAATATSSSSGNGSWRSLGLFMKSENLKTREIMQNIKAPMGYGSGGATAYATPDERLRQVNKRLASLKRRLAAYEEAFEHENGYRASQADKQNDRCMKGVVAEMHKLRREKQLLKADPMTAMGLRGGAGAVGGSGGAEVASRLVRVRETLQEIEMHLADKRTAAQRSFVLDELTTDQLMHEKTAVQKALVYFESLHGRPSTREERDAARDLYARYRTLKRLVHRTVSLQMSGISGLSELPTIMEHEAMQFHAPAVETAVPVATAAAVSIAATAAAIAPIAVAPDSPLSELSTTESTDTTSSSVHENVHQLSLDELWHHLEVARDQKQELRRTIKDFEAVFEQQNGRRMLKSDRTMIEQTYAVYKQRKAKLRLLEALVKKNMSK